MEKPLVREIGKISIDKQDKKVKPTTEKLMNKYHKTKKMRGNYRNWIRMQEPQNPIPSDMNPHFYNL